MNEVWRLVVDGPRDGATNMALDRATLACHARGLVPATLRIYSWEPPAVTIGRFQSAAEVDEAACAERGFDVARRPTGGRGVLHDDEVTYSIVAGVANGVPRGTAASYAHLCAALAEAYRVLGVPATLTSRSRGVRDSAACYLHATRADLSLGAAKLSGSAQVWSGGSVLQHGSFVISRDHEAECAVFRLDRADAAMLEDGTQTLSSTLGKRPGTDEIVDALRTGLAGVLGVELAPGSLTDDERAMAREWTPEHLVYAAVTDMPNRQDDV